MGDARNGRARARVAQGDKLMGTQFEHHDTLVAKRYWGGTGAGVCVQLHAGVAVVPNLDTRLKGDDGSWRTLRQLARECGRNGRLDLLRQGMGERNEEGLRRVFMGCRTHTHDGECDMCGSLVNPTSDQWDSNLREAVGRLASERALAEHDAAEVRVQVNELHAERLEHDAHVRTHERHEREERDMNLRFKGDTR